MSDATIRARSQTRDRLAAVAESEGLSLRAWLDRLAETVKTPAERAEEAERTRQILMGWSGYDPAVPDPEADALLAHRIAETDAA
ncbi:MULTISPECIES: hypothetical protein [unclassified Streptomyces]|uniref:hypothetical protein n=1 Tax=unclassified Streptomyces TaxID=2593676 RepID=UPI002365910E|nr:MULTISPECIES: hypothetical protein [unclassified Streptomyces]MDF3141208.1 hypothetical protein [Streptomyces sp. T21Q-yed]WDF40918.1 hypothetical protein PBV52_31140 [Streptomyces sp. T12]